jgi:prepilin peptidase CpaA
MHNLLERLPLVIVLAMLCVAAVTDYRTGLIPNRVVACGAGMGVLLQLLTVAIDQAGATETLARMGLGLLFCSIAPLLLYRFGALGGGDVKLFAAIGLCLGPSTGLAIQLWAHVLALALVPFMLARGGQARRSLRNVGLFFGNLFRPARARRAIDATQLTSLRFAPAIFAAAVWVGIFGGALR